MRGCAHRKHHPTRVAECAAVRVCRCARVRVCGVDLRYTAYDVKFENSLFATLSNYFLIYVK